MVPWSACPTRPCSSGIRVSGQVDARQQSRCVPDVDDRSCPERSGSRPRHGRGSGQQATASRGCAMRVSEPWVRQYQTRPALADSVQMEVCPQSSQRHSCSSPGIAPELPATTGGGEEGTAEGASTHLPQSVAAMAQGTPNAREMATHRHARLRPRCTAHSGLAPGARRARVGGISVRHRGEPPDTAFRQAGFLLRMPCRRHRAASRPGVSRVGHRVSPVGCVGGVTASARGSFPRPLRHDRLIP